MRSLLPRDTLCIKSTFLGRFRENIYKSLNVLSLRGHELAPTPCGLLAALAQGFGRIQGGGLVVPALADIELSQPVLGLAGIGGFRAFFGQ